MLMDFERIGAERFGALPLPPGSWYRRAGFVGARSRSLFIVSKQEGLFAMAAVCDICGKHPGFGMSVSFSHKRNPRRWNPNVQRIRILEGRRPVRRNVCTSCIKANKVQRAI
jgi:large subunit ribosomal protein L28